MDFNNTLKIIKSVISPIENSPIKNKAFELLYTLELKINSISHDGRARQLEELIKRIDEANAGYIMQEGKTGKIFYPVIADMFIFELQTMKIIQEPFILALWERYRQIMQSEKSKEMFERLQEDEKRAVKYLLSCKTRGKQRHYLASLFSKELKIAYSGIKKLIEHLFYQTPKNAKLPKEPMKKLPEPITNPLQFSYPLVA